MLGTQAAQGRPKKQAVIDDYCQRLRSEFVETQPAVFSGPNPWVQLEDAPGRVLEGMLALVYAEGSQARWVVLLVRGPHHEWTQTVNYFYAADNRLVKRERYLDQVPANTALQEVLYYQDGAVFSKTSHHQALKAGREDGSQFDDPNAPEFGSVEELPFPYDTDSLRPLAMGKPRQTLNTRGCGAAQGLVEIPNQILNIFQANGEPHEFRSYSSRFLLRCPELLVRSRSRMNHQTARVAYIGEMRKEL